MLRVGNQGVLAKDGALRRLYNALVDKAACNTPGARAAYQAFLTAYAAERMQQLWVTACDECLHQLQAARVPKDSLVCVDTGSDAISCHDHQPLPPLSLVERVLLAPHRAMRHTIICKPTEARARSADTYTRGIRGHLIAFNNPPTQCLANCFPCPLGDVPVLLNVGSGALMCIPGI